MNYDTVFPSAYPLLGIFYFSTHPALYKTTVPVLTKAATSSLAITIGLFVFTYLPQLAFCALFSGPLAFIPATVMVLGEAYILSMFVAKTFFLGPAQDALFDAVLVQQGNAKLVERGREIRVSSSGLKVVGRPLTRPLKHFTKEGIMRYVISLPLNSIPVVGTLCFLYYNGLKSGPSFHERYFQLKRLDNPARHTIVEQNRASYTAFGIVALALNLIPVVGSLFSITNTIGAALWASKLEGHAPDTQKDAEQVVIEQ